MRKIGALLFMTLGAVVFPCAAQVQGASMESLGLSLRLLVLLAVANTAPIAAKHVLGTRCNWPLDGGLRFFDGRPLLGPSKTVRGLVAASMLGDALSSFAKRRLGIASSGKATGLDQIPEALLPLLAVQAALGLSWLHVFAITLVFFLLEMPLAWLSFRLGLRDRPY